MGIRDRLYIIIVINIIIPPAGLHTIYNIHNVVKYYIYWGIGICFIFSFLSHSPIRHANLFIKLVYNNVIYGLIYLGTV